MWQVIEFRVWTSLKKKKKKVYVAKKTPPPTIKSVETLPTKD